MTPADAIKNEIECVDIALRGHGLPTYSAMREQRDELLEALVRLMRHAPVYPDESGYQAAKDRALAAIAKATS